MILRDLGSTNGSFCNDRPVAETALADGDSVRCGHVTLKFFAGYPVEYDRLQLLADVALRDPVTDLFDQDTLRLHLERSLARCRDLREPLALLLIGLDRLKGINDELGRRAGDAVLAWFAQRLRDSVRRADLTARYGGDECGVILAHLNLGDAGVVAERIRGDIEAHPFEFEHTRIPVTISIGVAERAERTEDAASLIARGHTVLRQAKQQGRNLVWLAPDPG